MRSVHAMLFCPGCKRWLLVRRNISKPDEMRAYICYAPENTPTNAFIRVAGTRGGLSKLALRRVKARFISLSKSALKSFFGIFSALFLTYIFSVRGLNGASYTRLLLCGIIGMLKEKYLLNDWRTFLSLFTTVILGPIPMKD